MTATETPSAPTPSVVMNADALQAILETDCNAMTLTNVQQQRARRLAAGIGFV
jgi:hypothetical protein